MSGNELPLFPLGRAIVPGATLKLQLFEQRYLKLIRDCMASGQGFGIVGLKSGGEAITSSTVRSEFYQVGCRVEIADWDQLQNGLLGISVLAQERFLIRSSSQQEDGLWTAQVEWLEDERLVGSRFEEQPPSLEADYEGLIELYQSLAAHSSEVIEPIEDAAVFGWAIASLLPIGNADFAELLTENDPLSRLRILSKKIDRLSMQ